MIFSFQSRLHVQTMSSAVVMVSVSTILYVVMVEKTVMTGLTKTNVQRVKIRIHKYIYIQYLKVISINLLSIHAMNNTVNMNIENKLTMDLALFYHSAINLMLSIIFRRLSIPIKTPGGSIRTVSNRSTRGGVRVFCSYYEQICHGNQSNSLLQ